MSSDKDNHTNGKNRRRNVALACEGCRQRKRRCDGAQPVCGICLKRKTTCVYSKRYTRAHANAEYVKSLEEKLGILRNDIPKSVDMIQSPSIVSEGYQKENADSKELVTHSSTRSQSVSHSHTSTSGSYPGLNQNLQNSNDSAIRNNEGTANFRDEDMATDAMGAGSGAVSNKNRDKSFFGRSAAMSFMKELFESVDHESIDNFEPESVKSITYKMSRHEKERSTISLSRIVVPPRGVADGYVKIYFENTYPLYPFVHKPTFMSAYEEIWSSDTNNCELDELFYCILNIIFAFGYHLSPLEEHLESSKTTNVYFERSQELLKFHLMDAGSLLLIQALLLTGQFLQATTRLAGCWNIVGLTIRIAQSLGLHMEKSLSPQRSYIEQEIEKRLWHGCLLMDKIVSMTFGRPLMVVEDQAMNPPVYIDDEYVHDTNINYPPIEKPSVLRFFSETVKLYNIMADILKFFYADPAPEYMDLFVGIFSFQKRLYVFQGNIPNYIKFENCLHEPPYLHQSIVLQIRYLHLKIMLYRPVLFPMNRDEVYTSGISSMELYVSSQRSISVLCINCAMELIHLIKKFRSADLTLLPASWYNVFYIYTAALILLAAKLQPGLQDDLDKIKFELSWTNVVELLSSYESQSKSAACCLKVLEIMDNKIKSVNQKRSKQTRDAHQPEESYSTASESEVPTDFLYSLMYDTEGPFGGPFFYNNKLDSII
ncbi:uncharacterized protein AC631_05750 [Debaryomyces fabryi]|uniref:Zn(2)-C6 fungal-type domain-containing protein n=1 Tax=Debaryomyces fabryi TaxID=58627 RepID=A0A0V1PQG3_9ASCO|nr:uncharacterized protein AC631_05750 [Debaryomyces fabryi]KRZ98488.1 hypothetical protein AC631_05750 [Debaryomyces fabryi]CUM49412.1 unnamed protein product [Debaryomyces fabryi]